MWVGSGLPIGPKQTMLDWFFQRDDYITPKILETEAKIRDVNEETGREIESKSKGERVESTSEISEMDVINEVSGSRV